MIVFWIIAALMSAAAAALILLGAARDARAAGEAPDPALAMHRRELAEVDALAARGLLAEDERAILRTEAARRLLAAADKAAAPPATDGPGARRATLAIAALAPLLAAGAYFMVGAPGYPDQPFEARLEAWRAADPARLAPGEMAAVLSDLVEQRADDAQGYWALGIARLAAGETIAGQNALRRAVQLAPERADIWASLGDALIQDTEGQVGPEARAAFSEAIKLDPSNLAARYYLGRAALADGDKEAGLGYWRGILAEIPAGDPTRGQLEQEIAQAEAGGPSAAQVAAAQGQVGEEQIRAMVDGLATRLASRPNDAEGWVRLIRSYGVLGEDALKDQAFRQASSIFIGQPQIINALTAAHKGTPP